MTTLHPVAVEISSELLAGCSTRADVEGRVDRALDARFAKWGPRTPGSLITSTGTISWRKGDGRYELRSAPDIGAWPATAVPSFLALELVEDDGRWQLRGDLRNDAEALRKSVRWVFNDGPRWIVRAFFAMFVVYGLFQLFTGGASTTRAISVLLVGAVVYLAFDRWFLPLFEVGRRTDAEEARASFQAALEEALAKQVRSSTQASD